MVAFKSLIGQIVILFVLTGSILLGTTLTVLQMTLYIIVRPFSLRMYMKLNYYIVYLLACPCLAVAYYWSNFKLNISFSDAKTKTDFLKCCESQTNLALLIMNHSYELDMMLTLIMGDQFNNLGNIRGFTKSDLKYMPVIGWTMYLSDIIFVSRSWNVDKKHLPSSLTKLFYLDRPLLTLFCEGTRFTQEKYLKSIEFAANIDKTPLKYHLWPRSKGFNFCVSYLIRQELIVKQLTKRQFKLFNVQFALPDKSQYSAVISGDGINTDIYIEEIEISDQVKEVIIKSEFDNQENCKELTNLVERIYRRKDELVDIYMKNGKKFSCSKEFLEFKKKIMPLIVTLLSAFISYGYLFYYCLIVLESYKILLTILFVMILLAGCLQKMISRQTQTKYSSSSYGIKNTR